MAISEIYSRNDAMKSALELWRDGNNAGDGWAIEDEELEDGRQILFAQSSDEVDVYVMPDGSEIAVGDAHGPWAVTITE